VLEFSLIFLCQVLLEHAQKKRLAGYAVLDQQVEEDAADNSQPVHLKPRGAVNYDEISILEVLDYSVESSV
jgi:hypothetical protein